MRSKLLAACMALAAFAAFAIMPALASGKNTPLLVENGTVVPVGTKFVLTNVGNIKMTTSIGNAECTTASMTGEVTKNTTGSFEGNITAAEMGGTGAKQIGAPEPECTTKAIFGGDTTVTMSTTTNGLPWCLRATEAMVTDEFQIRGGSCSTLSRPMRVALDVTGIGTCLYQRSSALIGSFTTSTTQSTLTLAEQEDPPTEGNPFGCPSVIKFDMTFHIETDVAGGAWLSITS